MKETLLAYLKLDAEHLITNAEKAARILGIWGVVSQNSTQAMWALAQAPSVADAPDATPLAKLDPGYAERLAFAEAEANPVIVGSEPILEIATEGPTPAPGVRPKVARTRTTGR